MKEKAEGGTLGVKVGSDYPPISHLMYADDTFLFGKANVEQVSTFKRCLEMYLACMCQ